MVILIYNQIITEELFRHIVLARIVYPVSKLKTTEYLATLDRVAFSMTVAIDVISKVLIDKGLATKEELNKALEDERNKVVKEIQEQTAKKA
jgi:hypothetical protein